MDHLKDGSRSTIQRLVLIAIVVFTFLLIVALRWFGGTLMEALSGAVEAILIAAFLALTVDPFLKKEFFQEASEDIFFFWLGYSLPPEINGYIQSFVMDTKLLRRNCVLSWTLEEESRGKVRLVLDVSFDFENVSNHAQTYQQGGRLFGPGSQERVVEMRCIAPGYRELEYKWESKDFQVGADGWLLGPERRIPPQKELQKRAPKGGRNNISFGIKYSSVHDEEGTDTWKTAAPTVNVSVLCKPADKFNFSVDLEGADPVSPGHWQSDGILMKNQTVTVSWQRK